MDQTDSARVLGREDQQISHMVESDLPPEGRAKLRPKLLFASGVTVSPQITICGRFTI